MKLNSIFKGHDLVPSPWLIDVRCLFDRGVQPFVVFDPLPNQNQDESNKFNRRSTLTVLFGDFIFTEVNERATIAASENRRITSVNQSTLCLSSASSVRPRMHSSTVNNNLSCDFIVLCGSAYLQQLNKAGVNIYVSKN